MLHISSGSYKVKKITLIRDDLLQMLPGHNSLIQSPILLAENSHVTKR